MSNYALRSQLNALEKELGHVQAINNNLNSELSALTREVVHIDDVLKNYYSKVVNTLENCDHSMKSSHQTVVNSIQLQGEIEKLYTKFKQIELANKKIREYNNKKYYDFANYRTVRKIVQGMLDNLDIHVVSDQAIMKTIEVQHLQSPDYWLTCALISIMAWRNDDRALAERAMERAVGLDKKNSAIFYMLFNLRMGREQAALKWFDTYQQCELKGSDERTFLMLFSLISKTISDNIEEKTRDEIYSFIRKVMEHNIQSSGYDEKEIVEKIRTYFDKMEGVDRLPYPLIYKHCKESKDLIAISRKAQNNMNILEFILNVVHIPLAQKNTFLKKYIDELISVPNEEEKSTYDKIAYNELIIKFDGDVKKAKKQAKAIQNKKDDELNLIDEMIQWLYGANSQEVNGQMKLNLFTLTKWIQEKAVDRHVEHYRSIRKKKYPVIIEDYTTTVTLEDQSQEENKVQAFCKKKKEEEIKAIPRWQIYFGDLLTFLGVGSCIFVGIQYWVLVLIGISFRTFMSYQYKLRKKQIEKYYEKRSQFLIDKVKKIIAELKKYNQDLEKYDAYYEQIKDELAKV